MCDSPWDASPSSCSSAQVKTKLPHHEREYFTLPEYYLPKMSAQKDDVDVRTASSTPRVECPLPNSRQNSRHHTPRSNQWPTSPTPSTVRLVDHRKLYDYLDVGLCDDIELGMPEKELPSHNGWRQMLDPEGRPFWVCEATQEVSWTLPGEEWAASWDKHGNCFWVNKEGYMAPRESRKALPVTSQTATRNGALRVQIPLFNGLPLATSLIVALAQFIEKVLASILEPQPWTQIPRR